MLNIGADNQSTPRANVLHQAIVSKNVSQVNTPLKKSFWSTQSVAPNRLQINKFKYFSTKLLKINKTTWDLLCTINYCEQKNGSQMNTYREYKRNASDPFNLLPVLILAGIFDLVLVFILRRKRLIVLVTLSHSVLVDEKSLHFSQLFVKLQLPTFILVAILYVVFIQK